MDTHQADKERRQRDRISATVARISAVVILASTGLIASVSTQLQLCPSTSVAHAASLAHGALAAGPDGIYSRQQAKRGEQIYQRDCASCHQEDLSGRRIDGGPALRGRRFTSRWGGLSIQALLTTMEELMPAKHPLDLLASKSPDARLDRQAYVDVVSFILQVNGLPAGKADLPTNPDALQKIVVHFER